MNGALTRTHRICGIGCSIMGGAPAADIGTSWFIILISRALASFSSKPKPSVLERNLLGSRVKISKNLSLKQPLYTTPCISWNFFSMCLIRLQWSSASYIKNCYCILSPLSLSEYPVALRMECAYPELSISFPISRAILRFISSEALFVKVTASIECGETLFDFFV